MKIDFVPILNKIYLFDKHSLLFLISGQGVFQIDFRNYSFTANVAMFLSPGQYFQLLSGKFNMTLYEFSQESISQSENSRFLFKHLISLGHVDFNQFKQFHLNLLLYLNISNSSSAILSAAIDDWTEQNPFDASGQDINLLFDLKDIIDEKYTDPISLPEVSLKLKEKPYRIKHLTKAKLNHTIHLLSSKKLLLESQRKVIFTNYSTKEIAYELGFKDPTYFNRFFKQQTNKTPTEFRQNYEFDSRDTFIPDIMNLIDANYKQQHFVEFYANQLCLSVKTLSRKINEKFGTSMNQLIQERKLREAVQMLQQNIPIHLIAFELGFKEANHFSAFFKRHKGKTPTEYLSNF